MYLMLGSLTFTLDNVLTLAYTFKQGFAEQPKIEAPPTLQLVGRELSTCKLGLRFIYADSDPDAAIADLLKAAADAKPMSLIDGSNNYAGKYVIESIDVAPKKTDAKGISISVDATLSLKEFRTAAIAATTISTITSPFKKIS